MLPLSSYPQAEINIHDKPFLPVTDIQVTHKNNPIKIPTIKSIDPLIKTPFVSPSIISSPIVSTNYLDDSYVISHPNYVNDPYFNLNVNYDNDPYYEYDPDYNYKMDYQYSPSSAQKKARNKFSQAARYCKGDYNYRDCMKSELRRLHKKKSRRRSSKRNTSRRRSSKRNTSRR